MARMFQGMEKPLGLDGYSPPCDVRSEGALIGAVLVARTDYAVGLVKRLKGEQFWDEYNGWFWDRLRWALLTKKLDWMDDSQRRWWMLADGLCEHSRQKYGTSLARNGSRWINAGFWWNGHWYADKVYEAWQKRERVAKAAETLKAALENAIT